MDSTIFVSLIQGKKYIRDYLNKNINNSNFKISKICLGEALLIILRSLKSIESLKDFRARNTDITAELGMLMYIIKKHLVDNKTIEIIEPHENIMVHFDSISSRYQYNKPVADIFIIADACAHTNATNKNSIFLHNNPRDYESHFLKQYTKDINLTIKSLQN